MRRLASPRRSRRATWPCFFSAATLPRMRDQHVAEFLQLGAIADRLAMAGNDDRAVGRRRQVGVGRPDRAVDAAAGRIVDERIDAVPERVAGMHDVGLERSDRDVAVGVGRRRNRPGRSLCRSASWSSSRRTPRRQRGLGQWPEVVVPVLHPLHRREVLARVLVRDDLGTELVQPLVAVGVVEMPMRVDQMGDRLGPECRTARFPSAGAKRRCRHPPAPCRPAPSAPRRCRPSPPARRRCRAGDGWRSASWPLRT